MTTPNIEELIERLNQSIDENAFEDTNTALSDAATALQSQAERIKALEAAPQVGYFYKWKDAMHGIAKLMDERDTLRAQLAQIAATEPVAWFFTDTQSGDQEADTDPDSYTREVATGYKRKQPLFTHPMPAQDVTELVDALEALIESITGVDQVSTVDDARTALSKYKGGKA